jgi:ferredoxin
MPELTIEGHGTFEVAGGTRLVNAIREAGVDILHRCGGYAKCTTCRVEFLAGEPDKMSAAERDKLAEQAEQGYRLSCQVYVDQDMTVRVINTLESTGLEDPGDAPEAGITPEPEWVESS